MIRGVFVGLATIDIVHNVDQFPLPDSKISATAQAVYAGGPATNAALTFRHLQGDATLVTAIGEHPLGAVVRNELTTRGVKLLDLIAGRMESPAISAIAVNAAGQRNVISPNAAQLSQYSDRVDVGALRSASIMLVDGHLMNACVAWARAAQECGVAVVLDGGSWKPGTERLLPYISTAICSSDFHPPGCSNREQVVEFLIAHGIPQIAITAGSGPIEFRSKQRTGSIRVPQVAVVDTMGAGDILHGAYAYYEAAKLSFPDALLRAAEIASNSCRFRGTREWMREPEHGGNS